MKKRSMIFALASVLLSAFSLSASVENVQQQAMQNLFTERSTLKISEIFRDDVSVNLQSPEASTVSGKIETHTILSANINGYNFHVADYGGGSLIVTALDGNMKGHQAVVLNGVQTGYSTNVEWHKDYFIHRYPAVKVTSYNYKQICQID